MQLTNSSFSLIDELPYLTAAPGGGGTSCASLPILRVEARGVPPGCSGVLITSDLQGVAPLPSANHQTRLLGEVLVEHLEALAERGELPDPRDLGVLIAGDMFSEARARKRGATGDVVGVWLAFARSFRWVAGVAGNHDLFPSGTGLRLLRRYETVRRLDGERWEIDGLTVGGVSGIIGKPGKPNRHSPERFVELLTQVLRADPDVVVLHQGPPGAARGQLGDARIAEAIARRPPPLVVCGHCHWAEPLASVAGTTVLNADGRAVLLVPATEDGAPSPPAVDG